MKQQPYSSKNGSKAVAVERRKVMRKRRSGAASNGALRQLDFLIRDQAWDTLRSVLEPKDRSSKNAAKRAVQRRRSSMYPRRCSTSYISLALSRDAPTDVVSSLLRLDPSAASREDRFGRLPLHVACTYGASVEVVHKLLLAETSENEEGGMDRGKGSSEKPTMAAAVAPSDGEIMTPFALRADSDGRVPLHYASEYAVGSYGDTLDVVAVLRAACPEAALAKDQWDETPRGIAESMEEAAKLDGDCDMVEAARAVGRLLRQSSNVMSQRSGQVWARESAMRCKSVQTENQTVKEVKNGTMEKQQKKYRINFNFDFGRLRRDDKSSKVELDTPVCQGKCGVLIADFTSEAVHVLSPTEECLNPSRRLFRRKRCKVYGI